MNTPRTPRILLLTHSVIGDRSYGGPMRGNALRDALCANGSVDTVTVHSSTRFELPVAWGPDRARTATVTRTGLSRVAITEHRALSAWVGDLVRDGDYDVVVAQYVELARLLTVAGRRRMIFDPDDFRKTPPPGVAVSTTERLKLARRNYLARRVATQALHVWYANPAPDQLPPTPRRSFLPNVVVAPDGARARRSPTPGRILMVGSFFHPPNVEGLAWFATMVLPRLKEHHPHSTLHVIGQHESDLRAQLPGVTFHGYVDDLTSAYDEAALVIAPIRSGGGTQIKVIDALAHGRPLVASDFAHSGFAEDLHPDTHLRTATTVDDWLRQCAWVLDEPVAAEAMGRRGEDAARTSFGPERMAAAVRETLDRVAASPLA